MEQIADSRGRRLVLLCGAPEESRDKAVRLLARIEDGPRPDEVFWVANMAPDPYASVPGDRVVQHLGSEYRIVVFDGHDGFHPDAFAAATGTLRGDGDCVLLMPPLVEWSTFADPDQTRFAAYPRTLDEMRRLFLTRLRRLWQRDSEIAVIDSADDGELQCAAPGRATIQLNEGQQAALTAVERVARGHARRPLVITADRGRGKSTVLGMGAGRLLLSGCRRVVVVAPGRAAVATLVRHACMTANLDTAVVFDSTLPIGAGELVVRTPGDWCDHDMVGSGLLIVEEAAAMPVAFLTHLVSVANRVVFATTVHGYEGSGRGFELRFCQSLDRLMPQWRALRLIEPVRWMPGDRLEKQVNGALLLDTELAESAPFGEVTVSLIETEQLAEDEELLRAIFTLLINAHYQTRPSDLRQLLDNPDVVLWLARSGDTVVGVMMGVVEGGFDKVMAARVLAGERRPRGHLLVQSLAVHAGIDACLTQRVLRVQRIAVHPARRREGIGRRLLQAGETWARANGFDLLGCAFGAEPPLLAFWHGCGLRPARIGLRKDAASATHSLFMLRGLSSRGRKLAREAVGRFLSDLPWALGTTLAEFDTALAGELLADRDCVDLRLLRHEVDALERIAAGSRSLVTASSLMWKVVVRLAAERVVNTERLAPLLAWQLQHQAVDTVCTNYGFSGQNALTSEVRNILALAAREEAQVVDGPHDAAYIRDKLERCEEIVMLNEGDDAPEFHLPDADMSMLESSDLAGAPYVIYFYPKDDTPGCTLEGLEFTELMSEFEAANTPVIGVSKDTCVSHAAFRDKHGINVHLLADVEGQLCEAYGVWQEKEKNGEKRMSIVRSTFVIDAQGKVRHALYDVKPKGHAKNVLEIVRSL